MKYALNLPPKTDGVGGLPVESITSSGGQSYLTLSYTKVLAATDITYTVEVSSDLQNWSSGSGVTATPTVVNNAGGTTQTVTVQDLTAATAPSRRFIRLRITE